MPPASEPAAILTDTRRVQTGALKDKSSPSGWRVDHRDSGDINNKTDFSPGHHAFDIAREQTSDSKL